MRQCYRINPLILVVVPLAQYTDGSSSGLGDPLFFVASLSLRQCQPSKHDQLKVLGEDHGEADISLQGPPRAVASTTGFLFWPQRLVRSS